MEPAGTDVGTRAALDAVHHVGRFQLGQHPGGLVLVQEYRLEAHGAHGLYRLLLRKNNTLGDLSAAVTGLLIAMVSPVTTPYWILLIGDFFAIVVVKQLFGGVGKNFLNPALAARAEGQGGYRADIADGDVPGDDLPPQEEQAAQDEEHGIAMVSPVTTPYWILLIGDFFAIVVVKQLFGGVGKNFLNPALAARAFMLSWAGEMTTWVGPKTSVPLMGVIDAETFPTPMSYLHGNDLSGLMKATIRRIQ